LTLMKVIRAVGARYLLGFADSPQRGDGLGSLITLALGGIVHQLTRPAATPTPRLICCFRATAFDYAYGGRQQYQALVAALAADEARSRLVVEDVVREASAGQPCLVLSERRDHLEQLARLLPADLAAESLTSAVHPAERTRIVKRFEEGGIVVLLATGQITTEAVCSARARRLFLTFPFSYARKLESTIRRLLEPSPGKEDAIVYDYDDPRVAPLHRAFEKRRAFLTRLAREADEAAAGEAQLHLPV